MEAHITREYIAGFFDLGSSKQEQDHLDFIMSHLALKKYPHNSYIFHQGDTADAMYFIEAGTVQVRGKNNELFNELGPGRYFGEYAALTGDKRSANILANGTVQVYELDAKTLQTLIRNNPKIYRLFLKKAYDEANERYQKLVRALNTKRGLGASSGSRIKPQKLFLHYFAVFFIFYNLLLFCPDPQGPAPLHPLLMLSPIVFLVAYIIITRRALEAIVLSVLYLAVMLAKFNFVVFFCEHIVRAVTEVPEIIFMVFLMGVLTRLFTASGSINALKYAAERGIKTGKGTLLTSFFATVLMALDEYLCVLIHSSCFRPLADNKRIAREKSAMVMGMAPGALCILSPLSLTGIYLAGLIYKHSGDRSLFIRAAGFNFAAFLTAGFVVFLALEMVPLAFSLKKAVLRVKEGGTLWSADTETSGEPEAANRGRVINLVLPVAVLIAASIIAGTLETGTFGVNVLSGLVITLIFTFILYCFQEYMTPEQYFKHIIYGFESMLAPIVMFVMGACFAAGMDEIGFSAWLNGMVNSTIGGQAWMLPALVFGFCTLTGALFDSPWAMYAIGIPIALDLAASVHSDPGIYMGAVCAAGLLGNEIAMGDIFFIGPMLGINPMAYYRAKLPYVILIAALTFLGYLGAGYLLNTAALPELLPLEEWGPVFERFTAPVQRHIQGIIDYFTF